jgi:hypothetical protein
MLHARPTRVRRRCGDRDCRRGRYRCAVAGEQIHVSCVRRRFAICPVRPTEPDNLEPRAPAWTTDIREPITSYAP